MCTLKSEIKKKKNEPFGEFVRQFLKELHDSL